MRANRWPAAVTLTVLAMTGMTACGSDDSPAPVAENGLAGLSGDEIVAKAKAAGDKADSVRVLVRGEGADSGQVAAVSTARNGDCVADIRGGDPITDGAGARSQHLRILRKDGQVLVRMDSALGGPADQWMSSRGSEAAQIGVYCELASRMTQQFVGLTSTGRAGQWVAEADTRIGGVPAVVMHYTTGDPAGDLSIDGAQSSVVRFAVAAEGEPRLLRVELRTATLLFQDYGAPVTVTLPPADQVRDLAPGAPEDDEETLED